MSLALAIPYTTIREALLGGQKLEQSSAWCAQREFQSRAWVLFAERVESTLRRQSYGFNISR